MRLGVFAIAWGLLTAGAVAGDNAPKEEVRYRVLQVDRCFTKVAGGKATLTVSSLRRTNDVFAGEFKMKVVPYVFKSDKGKLVVVVPDEAMAKVSAGESVDLAGSATTMDGKKPVIRKFSALATPTDAEQGELKVSLTVDDRNLVFETKYRFVDGDKKFREMAAAAKGDAAKGAN